MNDKIKKLLENAEQSDAIAINKWRIENREQLRKERKEKLKELMENNKQQTAVEWLWEIAYNRELTVEDWKQAKEMEKEQKEMSYAVGYKEGYKRSLEMVEWYIKNYIRGIEDHIVDTNKKVGGGEQ